MKKIILAAMALVVVALVGCQKDDNATLNSEIKVNFTVADKAGFANDTRAVKTGWESGDQILIVFEGETGMFDITDGANTLKLTYDGTIWVADTTQMPASGLASGQKYFAFYHFGEVSLGSKQGTNLYYLTGYKGGERLSYSGTYTIADGIVALGTINLNRDVNSFQISVKDLTGANWKLSICEDKAGSTTNINIQHSQDSMYLMDDEGEEVHFSGYLPKSKAAGVEYGGDVSFYFTKVSLSATQLVFKLSNGTDTYYYTKTGVTSTTLEGGKAYYLPSITDPKWETE